MENLRNFFLVEAFLSLITPPNFPFTGHVAASQDFVRIAGTSLLDRSGLLFTEIWLLLFSVHFINIAHS